jgi:hypothetical protein
VSAAAPLVGLFLRNGGNLHYFANLRPYLERLLRRRPRLEVRVLVPQGMGGNEEAAEYRDHRRLFSEALQPDDCDLVLTPTWLRPEDRPGPRNPATRLVQVFHGMSDKPFTYERDFSGYALCLCAGQRQADRLWARNRGLRWAKVGYPKFDALLRTPSRPARPARPTLIYCPTWRKGGISSVDRLVLEHPRVVAELAERYDLLLKPHPNLFNPARPFYDPAIVLGLERLARLPGVRLVHAGNVIPWQAQADLFLGDISAAGYEWLYFNRPMVFLNPQPGRLRPSREVDSLTYLWRCGRVCDDPRALPRLVEEALAADGHEEVREAVLHYSVHRPRDGRAAERAMAALDALLPGLPAEAEEATAHG